MKELNDVMKKPFCDNPLCAYHHVSENDHEHMNNNDGKQKGRNICIGRRTYQLVGRDGKTLIEQNLCHVCGNVIEMIKIEMEFRRNNTKSVEGIMNC